MDRMPSPKTYRGRSFRGQDLHGTRLEGADLRGSDFTNANLRGADLSSVRTGRPVWRTILLGLVALAASAGLGAIAGWGAAYVRSLLVHPDERYRIASWVIAGELVVSLIVLLWKGFGVALRNVAAATTGAAMLSAVLAILLGAGSGAAAARIVFFVALGLVLVVLGVLVRVAAGTIHGWVFYVVALAGGFATRGAGGGVIVLALAMISALIGKRVLRGDLRYAVLLRSAHAIVSLGGTRFRGADLTDVTFRAARLRNSDFRGARLDRERLADAREVALCTFDRELPPPAGPIGSSAP
jgi:Pentapeptide repeats (8 copies)